MPRNMSFMLTTKQVRARTKDVTRRLAWWFLKPGDLVWACEKCMGLKKGQKVKHLQLIRIVKTKAERLDEIARNPARVVPGEMSKVWETWLEGFPEFYGNGERFIEMFCRHNKCTRRRKVNRIEFEYLTKRVWETKRKA
jgi:hypothetical protein